MIMKNNQELQGIIDEEDIYENYMEFIQDQNKALITELKRCYLLLDQMQEWMHSLAKGGAIKKFPKQVNVAELIRTNPKVRRTLIKMENINKEKRGLDILQKIDEIEA